MKTKTKIEKQSKRKTNFSLVNTIREAKKHEKWIEVASILSSPRRKRFEINLDFLNNEAKMGEVTVFPGKVLSMGKIEKKIKVVAVAFSEKANEKLNKAGCETSYILEEIKKNPQAKGIRILK
jgi:large subunit ribosomal protein L18e